MLCSSISLISGQITYPDMRWSRCGRITEVGLYHWNQFALYCLVHWQLITKYPIKPTQFHHPSDLVIKRECMMYMYALLRSMLSFNILFMMWISDYCNCKLKWKIWYFMHETQTSWNISAILWCINGYAIIILMHLIYPSYGNRN